MAIDPGSPTYASADLLRAAAVQDVDIKAPGPSGETSGKALVVVLAGSGVGGQAVSIADGADTTQGAIADAAYVSGSGTIVSILKGIFGKLPASLGAKLAAASLSVVPATDAVFATSARRATFWMETDAPLAASATFSGPQRDAGAASPGPVEYAYFNGYFLADQTGTASIQCSDDGATWRTIATDALTAATPLILQVPVTARYHRVVLANGGALQGTVIVRSSYTAA